MPPHSKFPCFFILILALSLLSCKDSPVTNDAKNEKILAKVGDKVLLWSSIEPLLSQIQADMDTTVFVTSMINKWVADQLMILEAEKSGFSDLDIEELIKDYRASLLLFNYENKLMQEFLDTVVTMQQKKAYYESSKEQFLLPESLVKFKLVKLDKDIRQLENFYSYWKKSDWASVVTFVKNNKGTYIDQTDNWVTFSEFSSYIPQDFLKVKVLKKGISFRQSAGDKEYFINIEDYVNENGVPPFEYIEGKIVKVILNNRKNEIINRKKKQLFDNGYASKSVKIFYPK